jgi:hypothetical protein
LTTTGFHAEASASGLASSAAHLNALLDGGYLGQLDMDPWGAERVAFLATTTINRPDFGVSFNQTLETMMMIGDQVEIEIAIEAVKQQVRLTSPEVGHTPPARPSSAPRRWGCNEAESFVRTDAKKGGGA